MRYGHWSYAYLGKAGVLYCIAGAWRSSIGAYVVSIAIGIVSTEAVFGIGFSTILIDKDHYTLAP